MAALRLAASRVNPALESGRALFWHLKEPHINAPVRRRHEQPYAIQGVQARTKALLIPGFHGVQVVGAKLGNMAGLYGAAYQALQTR